MSEPWNPSQLFVRAHRQRLHEYLADAWRAWEAAKLRGEDDVVRAAWSHVLFVQRRLVSFNLVHGDGPALEPGTQPASGPRWAA